MSRLELNEVSLSFAGIKALQGISLNVDDGELVAVIGPNGAGKTSLFNCISGFYRPQSGSIRYRDRALETMAPHAIASLGVARMFQNLALFEHLTVLDNLLVGRHHLWQSRWWQDLFWLGASREQEIAHRRRVEEIIDLLNLEAYRKIPVSILPYGVLKRVELGRALAMDPSLLLLDEPAAGLNHEATEDMARYILDVKEELGVTQVLIEHDLRFVLELADRIHVLDFGRTVAEGTPQEVQAMPEVKQVYTGAMAAEAGA